MMAGSGFLWANTSSTTHSIPHRSYFDSQPLKGVSWAAESGSRQISTQSRLGSLLRIRELSKSLTHHWIDVIFLEKSFEANSLFT